MKIEMFVYVNRLLLSLEIDYFLGNRLKGY